MNEIIEVAGRINSLQKRVGGLERIETATITNPFMAVPLAISTALSFPALRLFSVPSINHDAGGGSMRLINLASYGTTGALVLNGVPKASILNGWLPMIAFSGSGQWAAAGDHDRWDILGTETYISSAFRGLTIWGWTIFDTTASVYEYTISKRYATTEIAYHLGRDSSGHGAFGISSDGTTDTRVDSGSDVIDPAKWVFMCARFDPTTSEIKLWLNDQTYINTTSIPSSIFSSLADLFVSGRDDTTTPGQRLMDGKMSIFGLCASALPDATITNFLNLTKNIYDNLWTP